MPVYNEALRLPATIAQLTRWQKRSQTKLEVILSDDGSNDQTVPIAKKLSHAEPNLNIRVLDGEQHLGAGAAARRGVLAARGRCVLLCDADGAVPFEEVTPLWSKLDQGWDMVCGSRTMGRVARLPVRQPFRRRFIGILWRLLVRTLRPTMVRDTQCGFKLFRRSAANRIFSNTRARGFVFHVEALCAAQTLGLRIAELPVRWSHQDGSRIRLFGDAKQMFGELLQLAFRSQAPRILTQRLNSTDRL